ncbi:mastermind-like protein 2 isoform X1 [Anguilla rostrata]|uniref:mastermind-like protein 2 isoform X1 n=2 Tax=Anguilla rostrata TaxID=7938 RepID=UPI0030D188BC
MGDTALPQPSAGGFVPMLGVGMVGSMPGAVSGPIPAPRGSAVPQLHNAIVERLRARIELCRKHHSTCESRYQRGQAENSDREHESTLHLLNIVHQGPGNRKTKGNRGAAQQPPEYNNRINGELKSQNSSEGDSKQSTRIALQGSLRRKIEGQPQGYTPKQNGLSTSPFGSDFKRLRMEGGVSGHGGCAFSNGQPHQALQSAMATGHALQVKEGNLMAHSTQGDRFAQTLREMKKEPGEVLHSCGRLSSTGAGASVFDFKDEGGGQLDPELQDLFDELTKSVPSLDDLEFDKILKQEDNDAFHLELGRPASAGGGKPGCPQLHKVVKSEYSPPGFCQTSGTLQQLRPASAGPAFSLANASPVSGAPKTTSGGASRSLASWQEVSHAEQLKQMAANQLPAALMHHPHHHQQSQARTAANWSPAMAAAHPSPGSFGQEKVPSPVSIHPSLNSQAKGMNHCLFKPNGHGPARVDMSGLSKPMLHFSPKAHSAGGPQVARAAGPQGKQQPPPPPPSQQQQPGQGQNQHRTSPNFPNPMLPVPTSPCLQPKSQPLKMPPNSHGPGLHFTLAQQRQNPPGPHLSTVSTFLNIPTLGQPQQQPPPPNGQQKAGPSAQPVHRPMTQPQKIINDADKISTQDQLSRHLTRPPPDYKQPRRNVATAPQTNLYTGGLPLCISSSQSLTSTLTNQNALLTSSCQLATGQPPKMAPPPSDRRFVTGPDPQNGGYGQTAVNQLQPRCPQNQIGLNPNKPRFSGPGNPGNAFGAGAMVTAQHIRPAAPQEVSRFPGPRLGSVMTGSTMGGPTSWAPGPKDSLALDVRRYPGALPPHPGGKADMAAHKFSQRPPLAVPNQVAPDIGLLPPGQTLNGQASGAGRDPASRLGQPRIPPLPAVPTLNPGPPLQQTPSGNFSSPPAGHNARPYQSGNTGTLTFDFLQEGDNTVPGINTDSDFIDSLLKSGPSNDDWMKDINLDEILGSQS